MYTESNSCRKRFLLNGSLGFLFIGILFGWSIIKAPLRAQLGVSTQLLASVYTISICFFCIGNIIAGLSLKKLGIKKLLLISSSLIFLGFSGCSLINTGRSWLLYPFYGVMVGCGVGLSYNGILSTVSAWFPDKKGFCSGLLMMCFGLSAVMWGKLSALLFQCPWLGWRGTYLGFGLSIAVVLFLCSVQLRAPGKMDGLPERVVVAATDDVASREFTGGEVLKSRSFWLYYIYGTAAAAVGSTVLSFAMDVCLSMGATAKLAVSMVGIASAGNGLGRVLCGLSFDRLGRKRTILLANFCTQLAPLTMLTAFVCDSLILAAISLLLSGLSFGTCPTIGSVLMSSFFGMKNFPVNYSLSNSKMIFSSLGATAASHLLAATGSYTAPYIMLAVLAFASFILSFFIKKP